jgi:protocatechuate 3,4-dioxygenase alpha subunit
MPALTPSQTIGPFFHEALRWAIQPADAPPDGVRVTGQVLDRDAKGVSDALLEIWQPGWRTPLGGLQRVATDDEGRFAFVMPKPQSGQVHANVTVFARGLLRGLFTRVYLHPADDVSAAALPEGVPDERRASLVARRTDASSYRWDVRLQGEGETVFFEI